MQVYSYDADEFQSLDQSIREGGRVSALAVLFEVSAPCRSACVLFLTVHQQSTVRLSPQVSLEDNQNLDPLLESIGTVSRFGRCRCQVT